MILPSTIAQQLTSGKLIVARHSTNTKTASDSVEAGMEIPDRAAAVSPDGRAVVSRCRSAAAWSKAPLRVTHSNSISG
jgi:hypothetical protein